MPRPGRPVIVTDTSGSEITYGSVQEAAKAVGMLPQAISKYLRNVYTQCQAGYSFRYVRDGIKLTVRFPNGEQKTFPSVTEAARQLGINRVEINRYLSGEYKTCRAGYSFKATAPGKGWY